MKCYVINNDYETIYEGSVVKVTNEGKTEYQANLKNFYVYDEERNIWEKHEDAGLNQKTTLERNAYRGMVQEYPSVIIAESACKENLR